MADATIGTFDVRTPSGAASADGCVFSTTGSGSNTGAGVSSTDAVMLNTTGVSRLYEKAPPPGP